MLAFDPRPVPSQATNPLRKQQLWKRKFAARDFRPHAPPMSRGDGRKHPADRLLPPQAAGMSCYSVAEEIMPGRADFLVERDGFEPEISLTVLPRTQSETPRTVPSEVAKTA